VKHRRRQRIAAAIPSALVRLAVAAVTTFVAVALLSPRMALPLALMGGWDVGGLSLLVLAWLAIGGCDARLTQSRAASQDPGRTAVYLLITLTASVSLFGAVVLAHRAKSMMGGDALTPALLSVTTVAVSWLVTQTALTLRYAHLYYREDHEGVGGVEFPGRRPPTYLDFAYFAFTIGMTFQTSDVVVTSPVIRSTVLAHAMLSFAYNTAILAFALQLAFGVIA
jgi:uncharacterized membrane protein